MELSPTVRMARRMAHSMTHSNAYVTKNLIRNEKFIETCQCDHQPQHQDENLLKKLTIYMSRIVSSAHWFYELQRN